MAMHIAESDVSSLILDDETTMICSSSLSWKYISPVFVQALYRAHRAHQSGLKNLRLGSVKKSEDKRMSSVFLFIFLKFFGGLSALEWSLAGENINIYIIPCFMRTSALNSLRHKII